MRWNAVFYPLLIILSLALSVTRCVTNPATGDRQLAFMSQDQEIALGRQSHKEILKQTESLNNPKLQRYVDQIGQRLAANSERPDLPWTFTVLDDPVVNAFALPGGYIYVTRGLLSYLTSEAELAGVLGHEIGHVTARHSVEQMSKSSLGAISLGLGMLLYPELQELGPAAQQGMQLLFLKFSRDDEREADRLGLRYMTGVHYDPQKLAEVMDVLAAVSHVQEHERMPTWLATHPAPEERSENIRRTIASENLRSENPIVHQKEYMQHIDGLVFGADPREGFFAGAQFFHPQLQWQMRFPESWQSSNQKDSIGALSPAQDAAIVLSLTSNKSLEDALKSFSREAGVNSGTPQRFQVADGQAILLPFRAQADIGVMNGQAAFIAYRGRVYQIVGYSLAAEWASYQAAILRSMQSFQPISNPDILKLQPLRIAVLTLPKDMSLMRFVGSRSAPALLPRLALINHVDLQETLPAGKTIKAIEGKLPTGLGSEVVF